MKRELKRRYDFDHEDIKKALLAKLRSDDLPYPEDGRHEITFFFHADGATLAWTDNDTL